MRSLSAYEVVRAWEWGQDKHAVDRGLYLLALAEREQTPAALAALTIGQRNARLLALRQATLGPQLDGFATCPACAEKLEFSVAIAALLQPEPTATAFDLQVENVALRVRLPDSRDLAQIIGFDDAAAARHLLLERCVLAATVDNQPFAPADLPDALIPLITDAITEHDPQAEIRFRLTCAACGHSWSALFDIISYFWTELTARAKRLLAEVDLLARRYGWREADILMMSPTRRQLYLEMTT